MQKKPLQNKTKPPETVEEFLGYFGGTPVQARSLTGSATASARCDQSKRRWNACSYWYRPANRWISLWGKEGFPDHESKVWEHQPRSWCHDYSHHLSKGHCLRQKSQRVSQRLTWCYTPCYSKFDNVEVKNNFKLIVYRAWTSFKWVLDIIDFQLRSRHSKYSLMLEACREKKEQPHNKSSDIHNNSHKSTLIIKEKNTLNQHLNSILVTPKTNICFLKPPH